MSGANGYYADAAASAMAHMHVGGDRDCDIIASEGSTVAHD